jgi:hypothetical protein
MKSAARKEESREGEDTNYSQEPPARNHLKGTRSVLTGVERCVIL